MSSFTQELAYKDLPKEYKDCLETRVCEVRPDVVVATNPNLATIQFDTETFKWKVKKMTDKLKKPKVDLESLIKDMGLIKMDIERLYHYENGSRYVKLCEKEGCQYHICERFSDKFCYPHSAWYRPVTKYFNLLMSNIEDMFDQIKGYVNMNNILKLIVAASVISIFLWAGFGIYWWKEISLPEDTLRAVTLFTIHITAILAPLMFIKVEDE